MLRRSLAALTLSALALSAQVVDRTKPPQTPPIPSYKLPPISESKLPNGLDIILVQDVRFPLATVRLNFAAGSKFDPADLPGLSEAVAALVTEGTKTRNSRQISEETDAIGGSLNGASGADSLTVGGSALSENLSQLLGLVADLAMNATFPADELRLWQQNRGQSLQAQHANSAFLSQEKFTETLFSGTPYAHMGPTMESIRKVDAKALAVFRDSYLVPNNATLILIGRLPARDALMKTVAQQFGSWQRKEVPPAPKVSAPARKRQIVLVDRPGSVQADIRAGGVAPTRLGPDYFPLLVANDILGGGTNSHMFKYIRERDGYAYDAHSEYATNREGAAFSAVTQVRNDVIEPAMKELLSEMDEMGSAPPSGEELQNVKNYISGIYLLRLETQDGVATQWNTMQTLGLPQNYLETYVPRVRSVDSGQVESVGKKYISPSEATIVVVGDASKIGDALKKFGDVTITKAN